MMSVVINKSELECIGKEGAWKYFTSIFNVMDAAKFYRMVTKVVLEEKTKDNLAFINGEAELEDKYSFLQGDLVKIGDVSVSRHFLNGLFVKNFFQYGRNSFDYVSQIINELFVDERNRMDRPDFDKVCRRKSCIGNQSVGQWLERIKESNQFKYLNDYCNQTKHNYDMGVRQSLDTATLDIFCEIPAFEKDGRIYMKENGLQKLEEIHQFIATSLVDFLEIVRQFLDDMLVQS